MAGKSGTRCEARSGGSSTAAGRWSFTRERLLASRPDGGFVGGLSRPGGVDPDPRSSLPLRPGGTIAIAITTPSPASSPAPFECVLDPGRHPAQGTVQMVAHETPAVSPRRG